MYEILQRSSEIMTNGIKTANDGKVQSKFPFVRVAPFLLIVTASFAQNSGMPACTPSSQQAMGCELVSWSQLQSPAPVPPSDNSNLPARNSDAATTNKTYTGQIVSENGAYVLKAADQTFQLDDQDRAKHYDGKYVKVSGSLNSEGTVFVIKAIEVMS
jgi:hypothetical protein